MREIISNMLLIIVTLFFSDRVIREEFSIFNIKEYILIGYFLFSFIYLYLIKKILKIWLWKIGLLALSIVTISFFLSNTIAKKLNEYNTFKAENTIYNSLDLKNNTIILYYGIFPTFYLIDQSLNIKITNVNGGTHTLNLSSKEWKIDG